jgi:hypothetical protein
LRSSSGSVEPGRHSTVTTTAPGIDVIQPWRELMNSFSA